MNPKSLTDESEAPAANGIVRCSIVCPLCGVPGNQFRLNPRLFWYGAREVDLQPCDFHCRKGMEGLHPPLFAMWHCTSCRFTAEQTDFASPLENVLIRLDTVGNWLNEARRHNTRYEAVTARLSKGIDTARQDFLQAIQLQLLAIWTWDLIGEMVKQDYLTQARYSLLLAWLYRDMKALDDKPARTAAGLADLITMLKGIWPDIPTTERAALRKAVAYYEATLAIASFSRDPVNEVTVLQRIGRIQIKLGEFSRAQETFRQSLIMARRAAVTIKHRLAIEITTKDPATLISGERAHLVDKERRLLVCVDDGERLVDTAREAKLAQQKSKAEPGQGS